MDYLTTRTTLKRLYLLLDARHGFKVNDREFATKIDLNDVYFQVILTKCDLLSPIDLAKRITEVEYETSKFRHCNQHILLSSICRRSLINEIRQEFIQMGLIPQHSAAALPQQRKTPSAHIQKFRGFRNKFV